MLGHDSLACISSRFSTVIHVAASIKETITDLMSHSQFHCKSLTLIRAWLSPRDKHMTTGRINQVSSNVSSVRTVLLGWNPKEHFFLFFFVFNNTQANFPPHSPHPQQAWTYKSVATLPCTHQSYVILSFPSPTPQSHTPPHAYRAVLFSSVAR